MIILIIRDFLFRWLLCDVILDFFFVYNRRDVVVNFPRILRVYTDRCYDTGGFFSELRNHQQRRFSTTNFVSPETSSRYIHTHDEWFFEMVAFQIKGIYIYFFIFSKIFTEIFFTFWLFFKTVYRFSWHSSRIFLRFFCLFRI